MDPLDYLRSFGDGGADRRRRTRGPGRRDRDPAAGAERRPAGPDSDRHAATRPPPRCSQTTSDAATVPLTTLPVFVSSGDVPKAAAKRLSFDGDPNLLGQRVNVSLDDADRNDRHRRLRHGRRPGRRDRPMRSRRPDPVPAEARAERHRPDRSLSSRTSSAGTGTARSTIDGVDEPRVAQRAALENAMTAVQQAITALQVSSATAGFDLDVLQPATAVPVLSKDKRPGRQRADRPVEALHPAGARRARARRGARSRRRAVRHPAARSRRHRVGARLPVVASVPSLPHRVRGRHEVTAAVDPLQRRRRELTDLSGPRCSCCPSRPLARRDLYGAVTRRTTAPAPCATRGCCCSCPANAREGKTTSLVNLASTLAESGRTRDRAGLRLPAPGGAPLPRGPRPAAASATCSPPTGGRPLASVLQPTGIPGRAAGHRPGPRPSTRAPCWARWAAGRARPGHSPTSSWWTRRRHSSRTTRSTSCRWSTRVVGGARGPDRPRRRGAAGRACSASCASPVPRRRPGREPRRRGRPTSDGENAQRRGDRPDAASALRPATGSAKHHRGKK